MKKSILSIGAAVASAGLVATMAPAAAYASFDEDPNPWGQNESPTHRVWGERASNTSIEANQILARDGRFEASNEIFIVGSKADSYPDPLAATPLADCADIPLFMNSGWTSLDSEIRNAIQGMLNDGLINNGNQVPSDLNITILGGPNAVDARIEGQLKEAFPDAKVGRIAGAKAFETSYNLAADAAACYNDNYGEVLDQRREIIDIQDREAAYQLALARWEAARANYEAKYVALTAAQRAVSAKQAEIAEESTKLVSVPAPDAAELEAARAALLVANAELADAAAARTYFVDRLGAFPQQGDTTLDIKSTLGEYRALPGVDGDELTRHQAEIGVDDGTTLEDAILAATQNLDDATATQRAASERLAAAQAVVVAAARANAANAPVLQRIGELGLELERLQDALDAAEAAAQEALDAFEDATDALNDATADRPLPGDLARARQLLADMRDDNVRNAGNRSVYLSTVKYFGDALAGGPAAANNDGVVLLSDGTRLEEWTTKYLTLSGAQVVAVGGPASAAIKTNATFKIQADIVGATAIETARDVTQYSFQQAGRPVTNDGHYHHLAIASAEVYYDAVIAAPYISQLDGGLLLTYQNNLPDASKAYISNETNVLRAAGVSTGTWLWTFGGRIRVSEAVQDTITKTAAFQ